MSDAHWPQIDQVVAEVHDRRRDLAELTKLLERHGFVVTVGERDCVDDDCCNLYAIRAQQRRSIMTKPPLCGPIDTQLLTPRSGAGFGARSSARASTVRKMTCISTIAKARRCSAARLHRTAGIRGFAGWPSRSQRFPVLAA